MLRKYKLIPVVMMLLLLFSQVAWAAAPIKTAQTAVQNIRYSQTADQIRIVFDVNALPKFSDHLAESPDQLIIDFENSIKNTMQLPAVPRNDIVSGLQFSEVTPGKQRVTIDLKAAASYKIFTLANPNRVVVDITKERDQKGATEIAPGITYTALTRRTDAGPISAHIIDMDPSSKYMLKPVLSDGVITGLEKLQTMANRSKALVAVNGSYFAHSGEILGLLKIDGDIVSTSEVTRTALGLLPNGKILMDQVDYNGSVRMPDGQDVIITGVNHERGENDLILYNGYYDSTTNTNEFGTDYMIKNDKVIGIAHGNPTIPLDGVVLSAHGTMEKALSALKIGDAVKITQGLGETWDKTTYVIGAGPRLIKNNSMFLNSSEEAFPADITSGRAPRTALGVTKDGHILLLVVDGRQSHSIGMTLIELAMLMHEYGAVDAMNFDGGGSSEMTVKGKIVNKPSDGHERSLGDALVIVPKT